MSITSITLTKEERDFLEQIILLTEMTDSETFKANIMSFAYELYSKELVDEYLADRNDKTKIEYHSLDELAVLIEEWAIDRHLHLQDPRFQLNKFAEEFGELAEGVNKGYDNQIKDSIGDLFVVIIVFCLQADIDVYECVNMAYNEIKNRKGKIVEGQFVKEEDL